MASFVFCTPNETGALCNVLEIFKKHKLSFTRLESRPISGQPWHYWFYTDVEIREEILQNENYIKNFMIELRNSAEEVRLLGVYSEAGNSI
jgi:prephenate dehydratase